MIGVYLTIPQAEVLRLCSGPLGFVADDMGASERRVAARLATRGLLNISSGKRAFITSEGLRALKAPGGGVKPSPEQAAPAPDSHEQADQGQRSAITPSPQDSGEVGE